MSLLIMLGSDFLDIALVRETTAIIINIGMVVGFFIGEGYKMMEKFGR